MVIIGTHYPKEPVVYWGCKCKTWVVKKPCKFSNKICAICESQILQPLKIRSNCESEMSEV